MLASHSGAEGTRSTAPMNLPGGPEDNVAPSPTVPLPRARPEQTEPALEMPPLSRFDRSHSSHHEPGFIRRRIDNLLFYTEMFTLQWTRLGMGIAGVLGVTAGTVGATIAIRNELLADHTKEAVTLGLGYLPLALLGYGIYKLDRAIERRMERRFRNHL